MTLSRLTKVVVTRNLHSNAFRPVFASMGRSDQRTRHKEGVFQIIGPTEGSIEKGVAHRQPSVGAMAQNPRAILA